jgi:hypothetical protein
VSRQRLIDAADRALILARAHRDEHPDWREVALVLEHLRGALHHDRANAEGGSPAWQGNQSLSGLVRSAWPGTLGDPSIDLAEAPESMAPHRLLSPGIDLRGVPR